MRNSTVIYWKWEDYTLDADLSAEVEELCSRFNAATVFVSVHWVKLPFDDERLLAKLRECRELLHMRGKKFVVECCFRNEMKGFYDEFPGEGKPYLVRFEQGVLDENGDLKMEVPNEITEHYWRKSEQGPCQIFSAYAFEGRGFMQYEPGTLVKIEDAYIGLKGKKRYAYLRAGEENAGKHVAFALATEQAIPDPASRRFEEYYEGMAEIAKDIGADGVFSDEWGYDVILQFTTDDIISQFYDDEDKRPNNLYMKHISASQDFARLYARHYPDCDFELDFFHLQHTPFGDMGVRVAAINRYTSLLRFLMADNERTMYRIAKQTLGEDAFYGVHPTWWGSVDSLNFEIYKNGFYWWEAVRDIAQTDEMVIHPIRTALAHKWQSDIYYNMWYSMGTRDIKTYYRETYANLRSGGRTHYLSFRCPNEPVVLELSGEGLLESLEDMEKGVRAVDELQRAPLDCRVLVLFGMEYVTNWAIPFRQREDGVIHELLPPWRPQNRKLDKVLLTANELYNSYLCDLVPSTEIAGGSLRISHNGKPTYGSQEYDCVILLYPDCMDKSCYGFLQKLPRERVIVCGNAEMYNDATPIDADDVFECDYDSVPPVDELIARLDSMGVPRNRDCNGCKMQDGAWIWAADGELPVGNALTVRANIDDEEVAFDGNDYLFIRNTDGKPEIAHGGGTLTINGKSMENR